MSDTRACSEHERDHAEYGQERPERREEPAHLPPLRLAKLTHRAVVALHDGDRARVA